MAIAPLWDGDGEQWPEDLFGAEWPRPALRLVPAVPGPVGSCAPSSPSIRTGVDGARRRARRAAVQRRRRAVVLTTLVAGLAVGLALPFGALGGAAVGPHPGSGPATAGEAVYVVRPGDTLWSIAARVDRGGDPRTLAEALARETGSSVVVPGERIAIP